MRPRGASPSAVGSCPRAGDPAGWVLTSPTCHGLGLLRGLAPNRRLRRRPPPRHVVIFRLRCVAGEGGCGADDLRGGPRRQLRHLLPPHQGKPSSLPLRPNPAPPRAWSWSPAAIWKWKKQLQREGDMQVCSYQTMCFGYWNREIVAFRLGKSL